MRPLARIGALAGLVFAACHPRPDVAGEPGQPLPGLTEEQLGRFLLGRALFERRSTEEEGLGPLYNAERCGECHATPASGGSGAPLVLKATRYADGRCDLLRDEGGDNIQQHATPLARAKGILGEVVPGRATGSARVTGPSLHGLGLIEAIPDAGILAREDPADADHDGISGRAPRAPDGRILRFGRKGETATIPQFVGTALGSELGLTTPAHPAEETVNGKPLPPGTDPAPDPEIDARGVGLLADYVRFLAPPAPERTAGAVRDSVRRGGRLFGSIGCAGCHVPSLLTGRSDVAALDRRVARLYSDLLEHDLGPVLAGVCGAAATPAEYRTAPLWGLRYRSLLLHDGRAHTLRRAIELHGGEALASRAGFDRLSPAEQDLVLRFLASL